MEDSELKLPELELDDLDLDDLDILEEYDYKSLEVVTTINSNGGDSLDSELGTHLFVEGLLLKRQVHNVRQEPPNEFEDMVMPVYAEKDEEIKLVGYVELTTSNILAMQQLRLTVSLRQEGMEPIFFDKVEHLIDIAKTLRESDRDDIIVDTVSDGNVETIH